MAFDHAQKESWFKVPPKRLLAEIQHDLFYSFLNRDVNGLEDLGDKDFGCNWIVQTRDLKADSVIFSAGVGRDITFEHALADKFGAKIHLIDPSPTGRETIELAENTRPEFIYHPVALAGTDGFLEMAEPTDPEEGSWLSMDGTVTETAPERKRIQVPCKTLASLIREQGHDHVDLLKIDIEGAEYLVLDSLIRDKVPIRQIAVEFHNGILPGVPRQMTIRSLMRLHKAGYRLVFKGGSNHTLVRKEYL